MRARADARTGLDNSHPHRPAGSRDRLVRRTWVASLLVLAALAIASPATLRGEPGAEPEIAKPVGFVNDHAGVLDEPTRAKLEAFLDQLKQKTGAEFAILIVRSTAPLSPTEYKVQVFQKWGLGKKGQDNGLLMLVALEEREVRFETGYGLEGVLPDGLQSRIFRDEIAPRFRAGDYAGGVIAGVLACAQRIAAEKGVTLEWDGRELRYGSKEQEMPPWVVALIVPFVILLAVLRGIGGGGRRRRRWGGGWYVGPGGFGGGWGGGGFGGGGFGGGGGGGFGGFGGGSSGGGGGGGKW